MRQGERERERACRAWPAAFLLWQHLCTYMTVGRCFTSVRFPSSPHPLTAANLWVWTVEERKLETQLKKEREQRGTTDRKLPL